MENTLYFLAGLFVMFVLWQYVDLKRTHQRLIQMVEELKPRANSKDGARIVAAYETPQFKAGSIFALRAREEEYLAAAGQTRREIDRKLEDLQDELNVLKTISTSGWGTRSKAERE